MNKGLIFLVVTLCMLGLSACNTMEGFGKDVSKVGDKIEKSAEKHK
ncbi:MAG: entericidin A/B family lipoprotein [Burkholderiales bacterium]|nr:entericidin A/B family lipoprotein [Burkholderiales bacterium]